MQLYFIRHAQSQNNAQWAQTGSSQGRKMDPEITALGAQQAQALARFLAGERPAPAQVPAPADDLDQTLVDPASALPSPEAASLPAWDPQNASGFHLTHLYSSLMVRAVTTGSFTADALDLPLVGWEALHEEGGIYLDDPHTGQPMGQAGQTRAELERRFPRFCFPEGARADGWWNRPFEAEEARPGRARRFLRELIERHGGSHDRVAVFSHAGFYNVVMRILLNLAPSHDLFEGQIPWLTLNNTAITRIDFHDQGVSVMYHNRISHLPAAWIT